ncbi:MAG: hypothetical protein ACE5I5_15125 [Candidatus Heimdallarchaeota archaeon]
MRRAFSDFFHGPSSFFDPPLKKPAPTSYKPFFQALIEAKSLYWRKVTLPSMDLMKIPLIVDAKDPKWILLGQILKVFDSRPVKQQLAHQRMTPVPRAALMLRIIFLAMFFTQELSYVLEELINRSTLRSFARLAEIPTP